MQFPRFLFTFILLGSLSQGFAEGPLPKFEFQGVALHPDDLKYTPTEQLIHPAIIKTDGRVKNPLGKYYMYYAPHKHIATSMAYADSLDGPWKEYEKNPVIEGPSAPEIRWMEQYGKFFMWGHRKNSQTELWTSEDGIHFEYDSVSVRAIDIGTRNATYNRVYEYPIEKFGSRYITLYTGFIEGREIRCLWLAHSKDAKTWTPLKTPLVEPIEGDNNNLYGPSFLQWKGRNYVVYQDMTSWRGGNLKYVELDKELTPVGKGGKRFVLIDPPAEPPVNDRYRGAEFYLDGDTLYLYSSASKDPRLIVYATAKVNPADVTSTAFAATPEKKNKAKKTTKKKKPESSKPLVSLDKLLKGKVLNTIYETTFDEPIRMVREADLTKDKKFAREPAKDIDWVLEGPGEVSINSGRLNIKSDPAGNCVLWNTREFPESFVAEWDFQPHHPQGLAIIFFAARGAEGGSIFSPGLPQRAGGFANYTSRRIRCYHTSYFATDEEGVPRGDTHLKKNDGDATPDEGNKVANGQGALDGRSGKPHKVRIAKLGNRIILEIDGKVSFDWTDNGEKGGAPFQNGQIGFRQMRHSLEVSYGGLKVQSVSSKPTPPKQTKVESAYPTVEELPLDNKLPDPFQFFGSDRRVSNMEDWKERQAEMLEMVQHYSAGPAFPQTHNAKLTNEEKTEVYGGKGIHRKANLVMGPDHSIDCRFEYILPNTEGPHPLLFYVCPRNEYAEECIPWREEVIQRGYGFALVIPGQFNGYNDHGPVKDAFPDVNGNTMMAWIWGINEVIHYLDQTHTIDKIIVTGTSRFGKTTSMAGAVNQRIDLTVPVTGGFGVRRFNQKDHKQPATAFEGRCWSNDVFPTFAGQLNKMPIDQHFVGAIIAPRALLAIMGEENADKMEGHIESYEALIPVYEWLGVPEKLGLYDHSPGGHGFVKGDFSTILDFADQIFYNKKPKSGKQFDQISNPEVVGFDWKAPEKLGE